VSVPTFVRWLVAGLGAAGAVLGLRWLAKGTGAPMTDTTSALNDRIVAEAKRVVGLGASTDLDAFEDLLGGPGEDKNTELQMATNPKSSTCGLVVGGIWRRAGISHPKLAPPYHVATAISRLVEIAQEHGAWHTDVTRYAPQPGDTMLLDIDKPDGHVNTIVSVASTPTGWKLETVDGGAQDWKGRQSVAARTHTLTHVGGRMASLSSIGYPHHVTGFIDVAKLAPLVKGAAPAPAVA
jgi:hypothetical protein